MSLYRYHLTLAIGADLGLAVGGRWFLGHNAGPLSLGIIGLMSDSYSDGGATMARALLIKLHLYCSAFFAAAIVLVAVSGGRYLIGIKGTIE